MTLVFYHVNSTKQTAAVHTCLLDFLHVGMTFLYANAIVQLLATVAVVFFIVCSKKKKLLVRMILYLIISSLRICALMWLTKRLCV